MGWRHIAVTERRTKQDYARCLQWLVDMALPQAKSIRLVQDNLNTHQPSALYETFPPEEALRMLRKLEFHSTRHPWKPGSTWPRSRSASSSAGASPGPWASLSTLEHRVQALETERTALSIGSSPRRRARSKLADSSPVIQTTVD